MRGYVRSMRKMRVGSECFFACIRAALSFYPPSKLFFFLKYSILLSEIRINAPLAFPMSNSASLSSLSLPIKIEQPAARGAAEL